MPEVDATTLKAPLPGGTDGATVTMRPLITGEMGAPRGFLHREDGRLGKARSFRDGAVKKIETWVPCPVFLVEHPSAGLVLVDTGMPAGVVHDPKAALGRFAAQLYAVRAKPEEPLSARLRALGIERGDIGTVVMTHLHFDHAGGLADVENAVVVVAKEEWRSAHQGKGLARGYIKRQFDQAHDYRLVDYDLPMINSFATFGRSFDLFGDGSVVLVSTPGHTSGHQSVVLRLAGREALICGDAVYDRRSLEQGSEPLVLADAHNYRRSVREIRAYAQMTPSALVVPGHDVELIPGLDELY